MGDEAISERHREVLLSGQGEVGGEQSSNVIWRRETGFREGEREVESEIYARHPFVGVCGSLPSPDG